MTIEKKAGKTTTLAVSGRLDTTTSPQLETEINSLEGAESVVLDFKNLEYISSAGLRTILSAHKMFSSKGGLTIINVNEAIKEIFDITGFTEIIHLEK